MPSLLLSLIRFVRVLRRGHQAVALENAALRCDSQHSTENVGGWSFGELQERIADV
jgi:hypothetical protein